MARVQDYDPFLMSNLGFKQTGLPFVVWISLRGNARHDVRVWVSRRPRAFASEMVSVAIRPDVRVVEGEMNAGDLALLKKWVELNHDVLVRHWDGDLYSSKDAIDAIRPIEP